jgi:hypothetical protein
VHSSKYRPERRSKGQAKRNAMVLFGNKYGQKMETKEVRTNMALILRLSQHDRFRALANMALSPIYEKTAFTTLMEKLQITYHDLSTEYKALQTSVGMIRAADHIPDIMEQTAEDAKHREVECVHCKGKGQIKVYDYTAIDKARALIAENVGMERETDPEVELMAKGRATCGKCRGTGKVMLKGDLDRLKVIFDTFGLTAKGGGLALNVGFNATVNVPQQTLGELSRDVQPIMEGTVVESGDDNDPA